MGNRGKPPVGEFIVEEVQKGGLVCRVKSHEEVENPLP